jgi:integrase
MVLAALLTGARYGELCSLKVGDVPIPSATVRLRETKSGAPRIVYLNEEGADFFQSIIGDRKLEEPLIPRPDGRPWSASQQVRFMVKASSEASLDPSVTFHDLRRTFGALLARKGIPMAVIAEALGHKDERVTRRHYAHLVPSYVAETIRAGLSSFGIQPKSIAPLKGQVLIAHDAGPCKSRSLQHVKKYLSPVLG